MDPLMIDAKDITAIVDNDLCHSCGACSNVCHPEVITFHETVAGHVFPKINYDGCTACELCSAVCPGIIFGKTMTEIVEKAEDPFEGEALSTWVGQSKDKDILDNGQSGGVASAIILDALENDIIDTAIVAVMSNDGSIHGDVMLAYNKEDILLSQQSKYIPIPLLTALSKVKDKKERFAIVGLSCHIHGLYNVLDVKPSLKKQFIFSIGLICDRVMVSSGMDYLIGKVGIKKKEVKEFYFRDKKPHGYPGVVHIVKNKSSFILSSGKRKEIKDFFTPARCRICFDKMNIGADITIGDPHGIENIDRENGESLVISRTKIGEDILHNLIGNIIELRKVENENIFNGQSIKEKRIDWRGYIENWQTLCKPLPFYYENIIPYTKEIRNKKYLQNLQQALSLVDYSSRKEIILLANKKTFYNRLKRIFLLPIKFIKRMLNK